MNKRILVCGAGGFIGGHLVKRLKKEGFWVRGVDIKRNEFSPSPADEFVVGDLRDPEIVRSVVAGVDEIYQLAADMGGAGYIFTGEHDAARHAQLGHHQPQRAGVWASRPACASIFYSSSACIYPEYNQTDPDNPKCSEDSAYPAAPDSEYGWEKLFSERLYARLHAATTASRSASPASTTSSDRKAPGAAAREKAPAAICRKVAEAADGGEIEIWGDGKQTRSFLYIDECVEGVRRLMDSDFAGPGQHRLRRDGHHQPAGRDGRCTSPASGCAFATSPARWACAAAIPITA